jgi:hypothetical protein
MSRLPRRADESGGVLVLVALALPVLLLLASLVIDVGNWFEHKRHLQMQADAAALAGAGDFRVPCADTPIVTSTQRYAGITGSTYNAQIGGTPSQNVHLMLNSPTYFGQPSPVDTTVRTGGPCSAAMIDVKLTETDLPWFFRAAQISHINAHARVEIQNLATQQGALPIAVPDVNPSTAAVTFVNEANGSVIASAPLTRSGSSGTMAVWDNGAAPVSLPVNAADIGVRIALSGSSNTTCGQPMVLCYDAGSAHGLLHIRGYPATPAVTGQSTPVARDVSLFNGTCSDAYFSSSASSCTIGVSAQVDFGSVTPASSKVTATVNGVTRDLTYDAASGRWKSVGTPNSFFTIPAAGGSSGPIAVALSWEEIGGTLNGNTCKTSFGNGNKCSGSFGTVQRSFVATDARSGPVQQAQVLENGVGPSNSFALGTTHNLVVRIGITGSLGNASSVSDPVVSLRVDGNDSNASQNQSLDCDPNYSKLSDELANGCRPSYERNTGTGCDSYANSGTLWASPQPWPCVWIQTGAATNQVPQGLNTRVLGTSKPSVCPALGRPGHNNWSMFPNLPAGDPRILQVFLVPFGSFSGSGGSGGVPVTDFATFYVTGWTGQGQGFNNPCQGNGDDPIPGNDAGLIVGHFIKYIQTLNTGGGGSPCDLNAFSACVAVMTY